MKKHTDHLALIILDGWGYGQVQNADAIAQAETPFFDQLIQDYPNARLTTHGLEVGLPEGQMGNSEVGHLNIGAGRIVYQELARINKAIQDRELHQNPLLIKNLQEAKAQGKRVHLMGLLSDGGVHSHIEHLKALCDITQEQGLDQVFIHAFMDGRDTSPTGGYAYLEDLLAHTKEQSVALASIIGRYYAMDRDKRWDRIKLAYDLLVKGAGEATKDALSTLKDRYAKEETDEFIKPIICTDSNDFPVATIQEGDLLICFNFRTDRPREISMVLTQQDMPEFEMHKLDLSYVTMTKYDDTFQGIDVLFQKEDLKDTLGEVLAGAGKTQVRIAETEKYPHVTFFFNGGREEAFENEKRLIIPSPKVATYDLQPEMSANEITASIIETVETEQPNFICLNYANTDMVGHTGDFQAAMIAARTVDGCLQRLVNTLLKHNYYAIIIADHGNSDFMINADGSPNTAHTTNLVPVIVVGSEAKSLNIQNGKLADVAPTILALLGMTLPEAMTGTILCSD